MHLRRETEYAIRALIFLAQRPKGSICSAPEIAETLAIPGGFLSKIFQRLSGHGLVKSHRGRQRGYSLPRPGTKICLREILERIEGVDLFERCVFWEDRCGDRAPCLLHRDWSQIKPRVLARLERKTLADLARGK